MTSQALFLVCYNDFNKIKNILTLTQKQFILPNAFKNDMSINVGPHLINPGKILFKMKWHAHISSKIGCTLPTTGFNR